MSDILDKATSHFQKIKASNEVVIEVPEWDATLIARRGSAAQKEKFFLHFAKGEHLTAYIWLIIKRCLTQDGKRAFKSEQQAFKRLSEDVDPDVLVRIGEEICSFDVDEDITIEAAEKN